MMYRPEITDKSYRISVSNTISNGKISIVDNVKSAAKGTKITLFVEPAAFHELASLVYITGGKEYDIFLLLDVRTQTCVFSMPGGDTVISGTFERYLRRIETIVDPPGGGSIVSVPANTAVPENEVEVSVTTNIGYRLQKDREKGFDRFYSVSDEGQINWLAPPKDSFIMPDSNVTINARFEKIYTIRFFSSDESIADIILRNNEGIRTTEFTSGENVNVSINILDTYYTLYKLIANVETLGVNEDGDVSGGFIMPDSDVILSAYFMPNPNNIYSVTVAGGITNGLIMPVTGDAVFLTRAPANEKVYLQIQPVPGYEVIDLRVTNSFNGENVIVLYEMPASRPYFIMPARPVVISGIFNMRNLKLTGIAEPQEGGTVTFPNHETTIPQKWAKQYR